MALPHSRTTVIRERKQKNRGKKRKTKLRVNGSTKSWDELFGDK